jgi:multiple sugar transport system ATP-binding protein
MRTELLDLHHRLKSTAIYVTHDQMEAMTMGTRIVVMKDGEVQQVDTPKEVYENPSNLFVAGFIGSPAMNLFDCTITQENGDLFAQSEDIHLKLPANKANMLSSYAGKDLVLGLRPENFAPGSGGQDSDFKAEVRVVELLGSEQLLNLEVGAKRFTARLDPESVYQIGETREFNAKMDLAHMFDPDNGAAIF